MRLKAYFLGYITEVDGDILFCRFQDPVTKQDYDAEFDLSKIEPWTERGYACKGAYFRIAIRRKLTFKFYKKKITRKAWRRRVNRAFRKAKKRCPALFK